MGGPSRPPLAPGPLNHLLDVAGLSLGHAGDGDARTGVTVVLPEVPAVASVAVTGGGPGTRETDLLAPDRTVERVDALVLSGGSAFGLSAADGAMAALHRAGRGFALGPHRIPIVPAAVIADLSAGGVPVADRGALHRRLGEAAAGRALAGGGEDRLSLGTVGAGTGATTADLKGGLGSASAVVGAAGGVTVAALAAVNPVGTVTFSPLPHFRAAAFETDGEFGDLGLPPRLPPEARLPRTKLDALGPSANTTIAVVATDADLSKAEAARLAAAAHDGIALSIFPAHTPLDGDTVFVLATAARPLPRTPAAGAALTAAASAALARAIARAVFLASPLPGDPKPAWVAVHGGGAAS